MPGVDDFIQVPGDSVGKRVESELRTRPDGLAIERQRMSIPGPVNVDGDVLRQVLIELRLVSILLAQMANVTDDLNQMRSDIATTEGIL